MVPGRRTTVGKLGAHQLDGIGEGDAGRNPPLPGRLGVEPLVARWLGGAGLDHRLGRPRRHPDILFQRIAVVLALLQAVGQQEEARRSRVHHRVGHPRRLECRIQGRQLAARAPARTRVRSPAETRPRGSAWADPSSRAGCRISRLRPRPCTGRWARRAGPDAHTIPAAA